MQKPPGTSAGWRFLRKSGFALASAAFFGALFGVVLYFRVPRATWEEAAGDLPMHLRVRRWLEQLELRTYDWRARELGRQSEPSEEVVVVALDDETLAVAGTSADPAIASWPWPREVMGGLVREMVAQGARLVLVDFLFPALSPRACPTDVGAAFGLDGPELDDDLRFRRLLDAAPGRSILAFSGEREERKLIVSQLLRELALVEQVESREETYEILRKVLATRRPAFSVPDGQRHQIWAGVASASDAAVLLGTLGVRGSAEPVLRARTDVEKSYEVTAGDLTVALASVEVEGLDPGGLPTLEAIVHPVAAHLGTASGYGHVLARPDAADGSVRGIQHLYRTRDGGRLLPSMALAAAMRLAGSEKLSWRDGRLYIGDTLSFPMDETGYSLIRWDAPEGYGARGSLANVVPAWNVLRHMRERQQGKGSRPLSHLRDKVVVFADTTTRGADFRRSPIGEVTPGGAIIAQSLVNILRQDGIVRVPARYDLLAAVGMALAGALLALALSGGLRSTGGVVLYVAALLAVIGAYVYVARYLFVSQQQWLAIVGPVMAMGAAFAATTLHTIRSEREVREFIVSVLGRSVSPEVARRVARDFGLIRPERREVTVCFSDIEGFTRISEQADPGEAIAFLEQYFAEMAGRVRETGGHLDKFIGDAVMALWNAPNPNPRHASLACESALRMREAIERRQAEWERRFGFRVLARVGINTGDAVVGRVGSDLQAAYTAIGDAVNLAARLEGLNRTYGTLVLAGEATVERAGDDFVFREVDRVRIGGRHEPVRVYELVARRDEGEDRRELLAEFGRALEAYHQRAFEDAGQRFARCASEFNDSVSAVYVARCRRFVATPPPEGWDGVHEVGAS